MAKILDIRAPIPSLGKGITINHGDKNKVLYTTYSYYDSQSGYSKPTRVVIGTAIDEHTLIPNTNYSKYFPDLWKSVSNQDVPPVSKRAGLYALIESVCQQKGIIDILESTFGIACTNAILDYTMYSLGYHSNVAMNYQATMKEHVVFSNAVHDDEYYSRLFTHEMSETQINLFRIKWAQHCVEAGITSVYLAIDGSNDDCESVGIEIVEKGAAKSHLNTDVVGFMYAVDPKSGTVVTFDSYRGGMVDSKAIQKMITFLAENSISVKGVIIDRGFCDSKCLTFLRSKQIPFILMMKGSTAGHKYMMDMHKEELRWNAECWIPGTLLFGISEVHQLFESSPLGAHLHLFYDFKNGDERCEALLTKLSKLIEQIKKDGKLPELSKELKKIIDFYPEREDGKSYTLHDNEFWEALDSKGYFTIASSETLDSKTVYEMYSSRDAAEIEFKYVKSQLGYGSIRVQSEPCMRSRFLVGTICAVIREEVENACKGLGLKTNTMLHEFRNLSIACLNAKSYTMIHTEKACVQSLMKALNISQDDLNQIAVNETRRLAGELPEIRKKKPGPKKGSHHQKYDSEGNPVKQKPVPKPGTHHKVKYNKDGSVRKKPGPKPGSHHQKKMEAAPN